MNKKTVVVLDRDGVVNHDSKDYIKSPEEWHPLPGSLQAIATLTKAGIAVAVATNQSGVARRYFDLDTLHAIHEKMEQALANEGGSIQKIFYCPHGPEENCECRKPKPGLLEQAIRFFNLNLAKDTVYVIGDSWRDLQAAQAAHCTPILVRTGNGEKTLEEHPECRAFAVFEDLSAAVEYILNIPRLPASLC